MTKYNFITVFILTSLYCVVLSNTSSLAGVFSTPHFVPAQFMAFGVEPELTLTSGAGFAINLKYTQGLSDLMDASVILGAGSGPRRFRVGGNASFDFFPDVEGQPGIGLALSALFIRLKDYNQVEVITTPYIHKAFLNKGKEFEPFFALPFGVGIGNNSSIALTSVVIGSFFKFSEKIRFVMEFGVAINNTESYLSGGFVYYP